MSKWAEVRIQAFVTYAIEIPDDWTLEQAENFALSEFTYGDAEIYESSIAKTDSEAESIKRHADEKYPL